MKNKTPTQKIKDQISKPLEKLGYEVTPVKELYDGLTFTFKYGRDEQMIEVAMSREQILADLNPYIVEKMDSEFRKVFNNK